LVYEAENALRLDQKSREVKRSIYGKKTWTGAGFVNVYERSLLEFVIDGSQGRRPYKSGHYEIVLRYELPGSGAIGWNDIRVLISRPPKSAGTTGFCPGAQRENNLAHRIEPRKLI